MKNKSKQFKRHKNMYYSQWNAPFTSENLRKMWKEEFKKLYGTDDVQKLFGDYFRV